MKNIKQFIQYLLAYSKILTKLGAGVTKFNFEEPVECYDKLSFPNNFELKRQALETILVMMRLQGWRVVTKINFSVNFVLGCRTFYFERDI